MALTIYIYIYVCVCVYIYIYIHTHIHFFEINAFMAVLGLHYWAFSCCGCRFLIAAASLVAEHGL